MLVASEVELLSYVAAGVVVGAAVELLASEVELLSYGAAGAGVEAAVELLASEVELLAAAGGGGDGCDDSDVVELLTMNTGSEIAISTLSKVTEYE